MAICRTYEEWRLSAGPAEGLPAHLSAHLAGCPRCRARRDAYEGALEGLRRQVAAGTSREPDTDAFRALLAAGRGQGRPRAGSRGAAWAALAAVLAVALAGAWWLAGGPRAPGTGEGAGTVASAPKAAGSEMLPGQWIETGSAQVRVSDARVAGVDVGPRTRLQVGSWEPQRTLLYLDSGDVAVAVRPLKPDEAFEIRTPLAVVRVVGTRFRTRHVPGVETRVTCLEGEVKVETLAEVELGRVSAGFEARVTRDGLEGPWPLAPGPDGAQAPGTAPAAFEERPGTPADAPILPPSAPGGRPGTSRRPRPAAAEPPPPAPETADVLEEARRRLSRREAPGAVEVIRQALAAGTPQEPRLLALLGDALRITGRADEARSAYERAAAGQGDVPEGVWVDLAQVLRQDLGLSGEAEGAWRRYLERHPAGRFAPQALSELAALAGEGGRPGECQDLRLRLLREHPATPEAARALADGGRSLLARGDAAGAWDWFAGWRQAPSPPLAETALAGLVQARLLQGRAAEARELAQEHLRRFPGGAHAAEIRAFLAAPGPPGEQSPSRR